MYEVELLEASVEPEELIRGEARDAYEEAAVGDRIEQYEMRTENWILDSHRECTYLDERQHAPRLGDRKVARPFVSPIED